MHLNRPLSVYRFTLLLPLRRIRRQGVPEGAVAIVELELEAERHGLDVLYYQLGMVSSGSSSRPMSLFVPPRPMSLLVPSSRRVASNCLDKVGCGEDVVYGYCPHELKYGLLNRLPTFIAEKVMVSIAKGVTEKEQGGPQDAVVAGCAGAVSSQSAHLFPPVILPSFGVALLRLRAHTLPPAACHLLSILSLLDSLQAVFDQTDVSS